MPWQETLRTDQRLQFIADHELGLFDMRAPCAHYGVSRKTGYKWIASYAADDLLRLTTEVTCLTLACTGPTARLQRSSSRPFVSTRAGGPAKIVQYFGGGR
jgi:hypothetical protein